MNICTKILIVSGLGFAPFCAAETLPIVSEEHFAKGNHWTWTYYTDGDVTRPYSAERYEVIKREGTLASFEMLTQYEGSGPFKAHTRFRVDLAKCWQAFRTPTVKINFLIALYPLMNGVWGQAIATPSTAFEEKFNCNPFVHSDTSRPYETRFARTRFRGAEERVFQQWPKSRQSQLRSSYFQSHSELAGVAFDKDFGPGTPQYYRMILTDWGR